MQMIGARSREHITLERSLCMVDDGREGFSW